MLPDPQYIFYDSKLLDTLGTFDFLLAGLGKIIVWNVETAVYVVLPKQPINQFKPETNSGKQTIGAKG